MGFLGKVAGLVLLVCMVLGLSAAWAQAPRAQVIVLSDSPPHVSVIDGQTHQVIRTANIPDHKVWGYNDTNNYFDGKHLWLGSVDPATRERVVNILDVDSLQVIRRISLGTDGFGIFIGRLSRRTGTVFVAKGLARQLYSIDSKTFEIVRIIDLPIPEMAGPPPAVACDSDVAIGFDGRERLFIPAHGGNMIVVVDTATMTARAQRFEGTRPWMATPTPDNRRLWAQEHATNTLVILNTLGLETVERVPVATLPFMGVFSPDGKLHFTGHGGAPFVIAHNTETFQEVWRAQAGANTSTIGVHPGGTFVFAALTREGAVAVIDASTGRIVTRVALGTNPFGLFIRTLP